MNQVARGTGLTRYGDEPDLSATFLRLRTPLYNYFRRCGLAPQVAEDLIQAVFVKLLEQPERFDSTRGRLEPYVFGLARNLRRNQERRERLRRVEPECETAAPSPGPEPQHLVAIRQAVADLADEQREAVVLREFHGLSYEEIARVQEVPVGTVRSRLSRAREQLRQRLLGN